jgi:PBP1b-binding outer membrane lipoprotein LpoB
VKASKFISSLAAVGLALGVAGCATAPQPNVKYVNPGAQGGISGTGIESQDIGAAAQKAAVSILALPQIAKADRPPIIMITPVTNRSASPIDTDLYTVKLRGILMQYSSDKVRFLARDASWDANKYEQQLRKQGEVQPGAARNAATYDYLLTAELRGISEASGKGRSEYFLIAFKLVDMNDLLLWEDQYEIKKQGQDSSIYR